MAQAQRNRTSRSSSPAGEPEYDEHYSDDDICGSGCHAGGVPAGSVTVGCEHGTFAVTEKHWRAPEAAAVRAPETVHDRSVHFESERTIPADSGAVGHLLEHVNDHGERLLKLEAAVKALQRKGGAPASEPADTASAGGE